MSMFADCLEADVEKFPNQAQLLAVPTSLRGSRGYRHHAHDW